MLQEIHAVGDAVILCAVKTETTRHADHPWEVERSKNETANRDVKHLYIFIFSTDETSWFLSRGRN